MPPVRAKPTYQRLNDNRSRSERAGAPSVQSLLEEQAYRRTEAEEKALYPTRETWAPLLDPHRHSPALDAMIKSITKPEVRKRDVLQPYARVSPVSSRKLAKSASSAQNYIDLTVDEGILPEITTPAQCLAHCTRCEPRFHLDVQSGDSYARCPQCFRSYFMREHPCSCPPPLRCDKERDNGFSDLRTALNDSRPPLSDLAKRVFSLLKYLLEGTRHISRYRNFTETIGECIPGHIWVRPLRKTIGRL